MLEAIRIYADWLDGTLKDHAAVDRGVNAQIPSVPRWGSDPAPPNVSAVLDETRNTDVALKELPPDLLASDTDAKLIVWQPEDEQVEGWVTQAIQFADDIPIIVGYVRRNTATARVIQDSHYTLRAVRRSLNLLFDPANHAARLAGSIRLSIKTQDVLTKPWVQFGDLWVTFALISSIRVEDEAP